MSKRIVGNDVARFWSYVNRTDGCWLWTGGLNRKRYGMFWLAGTHTPAHRYAYELLIGPIPEGLQIDHLCRNPPCVNPHHLEPVTPRENTLRGEGLAAHQSRLTHCSRGHEFTSENTVRWGNHRKCRICTKINIRCRIEAKKGGEARENNAS
jgi:hypothetical protein